MSTAPKLDVPSSAEVRPTFTVRVPSEINADATRLAEPYTSEDESLPLALMLACCAVFAVAFAVYLLYPAISTLNGI